MRCAVLTLLTLFALCGCDSGGGGGGGGAGDVGAGGGGVIPRTSYATNFDRNESPLSEGGAWVNLGLDWTRVDTEGGIAFGTQTGTGLFDDSYAHLTGFPRDVTASAVVYRDATIDSSCSHEVELHLRFADSAHHARGYECLVSYNGSYAQIVRWNGPRGDFTVLAGGVVSGGLRNGDTVTASAVGNVITLYVNGVQVAQARDSMWTDGNPGIGFWRGGTGACGRRGDLGFTTYTASAIP